MSGGGILGGQNPSFYLRQAQEEAIRKMLSGSSGKITVVASTPPTPKPKDRPAGEFDGRTREFAAGVVTGTRSFDIDKLGRLVGVSYRAVWTPGENVAKCLMRDDDWMIQTMLGSLGIPRRVVQTSRDEPHSIAECTHGFYGYYEGSNDYYQSGRVMGVVEAYGETVIGTRGFRASKARIVALHVPSAISVGIRRLLARNYPELPVFDSFEAMVAEFPPDDGGEGINPANDPDFWTREA